MDPLNKCFRYILEKANKRRTKKNYILINKKLHVSQFKVLINVLFLNKALFKFGSIKSPLCSFCKEPEEKSVLVFTRCSYSQNIWLQTQVFFSKYFAISNISPQTTVLGFLEKIQDQHDKTINHILLIYKHVYLSRNSLNLNWQSKTKYGSKFWLTVLMFNNINDTMD